MRSADIDFLTMGQYLQPTPRHAKVIAFIEPKAFDSYAAIARAKGFLLVAASPLTRSSYHAGDDFAKMQAARNAFHTNAGKQAADTNAGKQAAETNARRQAADPKAGSLAPA
jgi:hypothetical protein